MSAKFLLAGLIIGAIGILAAQHVADIVAHSDTAPNSKAVNAGNSANSRPGRGWDISSQTSKMDDTTNVSAVLFSNDGIALLISCHGRSAGGSFLLTTESIQLSERPYVSTRVNNEKAISETWFRSGGQRALEPLHPDKFIAGLPDSVTLLLQFFDAFDRMVETKFDLGSLASARSQVTASCATQYGQSR